MTACDYRNDAAAAELRSLVCLHKKYDVMTLHQLRDMPPEVVRGVSREIRKGLDRFNAARGDGEPRLERVSLWDVLALVSAAPGADFVPRRPAGSPDCGERVLLRRRVLDVLIRHPLSGFGLVNAPDADGVWAARRPEVFDGVLVGETGTFHSDKFLLSFLFCIRDPRALALARAAFPAETAGKGWPGVMEFLEVDDACSDIEDDDDDAACFFIRPSLPFEANCPV